MPPALDALRGTLRAHAELPALGEGDLVVTYAGLENAVARCTAILHDLDSSRVALALDNSVEWVAWDLALLFSGRVCVPVPGFFSEEQQRHVLASSGVDTFIGESKPPAGVGRFVERSSGVWQREVERAPALPAGTRKITYTSGTTGHPKGVCLGAEAQLAVASSLWQASATVDVRRHLCVLPLATLLENVAGIYAPMLAGARIDLRPMREIGLQGASGLDIERFLGTLAATQPHSIILLPQLLLALVSAAERGFRLLDSLRFIAVGGGRVAPQLLERAEALGLPVFEGYGLSECSSVVCLNTPRARRIGTVGAPLPHLEVRLAPDGEVLVRGPRMLGYLGEAPPVDEWLATGDLGRMEEGFLTLEGRKKHMFVTAYGRNVNPEWVEAELAQQAPIAQAWLHGEARAENVAVLVPRDPAVTNMQIEAAVGEVNARLPDYARVHQWVRAREPFTDANGMATANGRLRRAAILQAYPFAGESPAPERNHEAIA